jgi:peptide/nickel transport system ATP-binding protein
MTLEIKNLKVEFPTRRGTLTALDDVSLSIERGEVLGVVGESGAGKSLTGLSIIGLLEPPGRIAAGEVWLEGRRIDRLPPEEMRRVRGRRIGVVFQDPLTSLNPLFTIGQQLEETIVTHLALGKAAARSRALSLLGEVGIPAPAARYDAYPHQFSGGMRQRVVIALAIAAEPVLIIADEPTTALDVSIQAQIIALLKRLGDENAPPADRRRDAAAERHPAGLRLQPALPEALRSLSRRAPRADGGERTRHGLLAACRSLACAA